MTVGLAWRGYNKNYYKFCNFFLTGIISNNIPNPILKRKSKFSGRVPVSVLIPEALQRAVARKASREGRSFSAEVRQALKKELGVGR